MSSATLTFNGTKPKLPLGLLMTVHTFFSDVNWDDSPPAVQDGKRNAPPGSSVELSLLLPVHQFFAAVNWEGAAIAAMPMPAPVASSGTAAVSFTLDDFSDLF